MERLEDGSGGSREGKQVTDLTGSGGIWWDLVGGIWWDLVGGGGKGRFVSRGLAGEGREISDLRRRHIRGGEG